MASKSGSGGQLQIKLGKYLMLSNGLVVLGLTIWDEPFSWLAWLAGMMVFGYLFLVGAETWAVGTLIRDCGGEPLPCPQCDGWVKIKIGSIFLLRFRYSVACGYCDYPQGFHWFTDEAAIALWNHHIIKRKRELVEEEMGRHIEEHKAKQQEKGGK